MSVLQVSTREFRDRQASILDMSDRGERVVIRRGHKFYVITPISDEDLYFTPEILSKIDQSIREAKEGKVRRFETVQALDQYLDTYDV